METVVIQEQFSSLHGVNLRNLTQIRGKLCHGHGRDKKTKQVNQF